MTPRLRELLADRTPPRSPGVARSRLARGAGRAGRAGGSRRWPRAAAGARVGAHLRRPGIDESSGLVVLGEPACRPSTTPATGRWSTSSTRRRGSTVGRTTYTDDGSWTWRHWPSARDGSVWVGDIGDNERVRPSSPLPAARRAEGDGRVQRTTLRPRLPRRPPRRRDAAGAPRTGRLFVVTKGVFGGQVLRGSAHGCGRPGQRLRPVGTRGAGHRRHLPARRSAVALRNYADGSSSTPGPGGGR